MAVNHQIIIGTATGAGMMLFTVLAVAQPGVTRPVAQQSQVLLSQVNRPATEGIPVLNTEEVRGKVTKVEGDKVELQLANGELRTYSIPASDVERSQLKVGSNVVLTVRGEIVVAVHSAATTTEATGTTTSGAASSSTETVQSGSTSSSSSTTVIQRQTTVQQTTPAPTPAAQPVPQPVRGLW